jgi:hypothetical protein
MSVSGISSNPPDWDLSVGDDVHRGLSGEVSDQASIRLDINNKGDALTPITDPLGCNVYARYGVLGETLSVGKDFGSTNDVQASAGIKAGLEGDGTVIALDPKIIGSTAGAAGIGVGLSVDQRFNNGLSIGAEVGYYLFIG